MSVSDDMWLVEGIRESYAEAWYFHTFNASLDRQIGALLREIDRRDAMLARGREIIADWIQGINGSSKDFEGTVMALTGVSSAIFEATNGPPCLCDEVDDGMKFVEKEACPRHGTPGKRFGEDGYVES